MVLPAVSALLVLPLDRVSAARSHVPAMRTILTIVLSVAATCAVLAGAWYLVLSGRAGRGGDARVVRIETPRVGSLTEVVTAPGIIEPVTKVAIRARISAQVMELPFQEGMRVTRGDPDAQPPVPPSLLLRLDDKDLKASLDSAAARLEAQRVQIQVSEMAIETQKAESAGVQFSLAQAELELGRLEELLTTRDVSQAAVDQARTQVDERRTRLAAQQHRLTQAELSLQIARHNLTAAQADMVRARDSLEHTMVYAPLDGVVTRVPAEVGEMATGSLYNPGTLIIEVADLSRMVLKAEVDETDIGRVKVGQKANVRIQAWPDDVFTGTVRLTALASSLDRLGRSYFSVEILLANDDQRILQGLSADVDIEVATHEEALTVPSQAVLAREVDALPVPIRESLSKADARKTLAAVAYRVIDGKAAVTPVTIGASDATHTILLAGLTEDDPLIVGPYKVLENIAHDQVVRDERDAEGDLKATGPGGVAGGEAPAGAQGGGGADAGARRAR